LAGLLSIQEVALSMGGGRWVMFLEVGRAVVKRGVDGAAIFGGVNFGGELLIRSICHQSAGPRLGYTWL